MTEQFRFTPAEIEQINKLDHYSGTETNDRLFPLIEQVLAPRWEALAREVARLRAKLNLSGE